MGRVSTAAGDRRVARCGAEESTRRQVRNLYDAGPLVCGVG